MQFLGITTYNVDKRPENPRHHLFEFLISRGLMLLLLTFGLEN